MAKITSTRSPATAACVALVLGWAIGPLTAQQPASGAAVPQSASTDAGQAASACGGRSANPRVACPADIDKMMAALPDKAPAAP
jgi:hypothetical protein